MKKVVTILILLILAFAWGKGVFSVVLFPDAHAEASAVAMKAEQPSAFNQWWWYAFWSLLLLLPALAGYTAIHRFLIVPSRLRWADAATGLHAVEIKSAAPLWKRALSIVGLTSATDDIIHNYNNAHAPTWRVRDSGNQLTVQADTHGLTPQEQVDSTSRHWGVRQTVARSANATRGPNRNEMLATAGFFDSKAKIEAAKAEAAQRRLMAPTPAPQDDEPIAEPVEMLTLKESVEQSTADAWIIGQNQDTGKLAYFEPDKAIHLAILGATGTGKTESTGMLVVGHALRNGYKVIILDGKGGADWSRLAKWAEYHDTDSSTFVDNLTPIMAEYERRTAMIKQQQAPTFRSLRNPPPPIMVLIEEYGDINDTLTGDAKAKANEILDKLIRLARNTGIHLVFIDQYPEKWESQLLNNTKSKVVYWLNDGALVKEYKVHTLAEQGEFFLKGERYNAWHVKPRIKGMLAEVPQLTVNSVPPIVPSRVPSSVPLVYGPTSNTQGNTEPTELQDRVWAWRGANPDGTQAQLRAEFERLNIEISKTHVHRCWHEWPGNETQPVSSNPTIADLLAQYGEVNIGGERVTMAVDKTQEIKYR